jgi:hypothetical protein
MNNTWLNINSAAPMDYNALWLPSGTYQFVIFYETNRFAPQGSPLTAADRIYMNALKVNCLISSIEFNIIP